MNETYVDWSDRMPWERELRIKAESYAVMPPLFPDVVPVMLRTNEENRAKPDRHRAVSPDGRWWYVRRLLKKGVWIDTMYGKNKGRICFDGDVETPAVWEDERGGLQTWMSLTPMEVFTLRGGTRLAKGTTVVAGLGMGYQLWKVSQRQKVRRIILVERSQSLVDWILPRVLPMMGCRDIDVEVGNVHEVLPRLKADVALVDTFKGYGFNRDELDRMRVKAPGIGKWWGWGTSDIGESGSLIPAFLLPGWARG
jgi:hypothetical protein